MTDAPKPPKPSRPLHILCAELVGSLSDEQRDALNKTLNKAQRALCLEITELTIAAVKAEFAVPNTTPNAKHAHSAPTSQHVSVAELCGSLGFVALELERARACEADNVRLRTELDTMRQQHDSFRAELEQAQQEQQIAFRSALEVARATYRSIREQLDTVTAENAELRKERRDNLKLLESALSWCARQLRGRE